MGLRWSAISRVLRAARCGPRWPGPGGRRRRSGQRRIALSWSGVAREPQRDPTGVLPKVGWAARGSQGIEHRHVAGHIYQRWRGGVAVGAIPQAAEPRPLNTVADCRRFEADAAGGQRPVGVLAGAPGGEDHNRRHWAKARRRDDRDAAEACVPNRQVCERGGLHSKGGHVESVCRGGEGAGTPQNIPKPSGFTS